MLNVMPGVVRPQLSLLMLPLETCCTNTLSS